MGYSLLYIAFGIVALWLLGEVLLQYKARLRWRVLAFAGFLGVAGGVAMREVVVIVLGAIAFGAGQSYVTVSYKRGFAAGWALDLGGGRGRPRVRAPHSDPVLEVSAVEEEAGAVAGADGGDRLADPGSAREEIYQPLPMHDDSGEYAQYGGGQYGSRQAPAADPYAGAGYGGYDTYGDWGTGQQPAAASATYGYDAGPPAPAGQDPYDPGYGWPGDRPGYSAQQPAAASYGYDTGGYPQQPAAGHDTGGYPQQPAAGHDTGSYATGSYDTGGYGTGDWTPQQPAADPYGYGYSQDPQAQQPYIPPQQQPYEQPAPYPPQPPYGQQPTDPYDPYRY